MHVLVLGCVQYLEVVGGEGVDDLWRDIQAWRARQREAAVQILATHSLLHQPVNQCTANQNAEQLCRFHVNQNTHQTLSLHRLHVSESMNYEKKIIATNN